MYKEPQNYEVSLLVMQSEGPLRTEMTFVVHTTRTYSVILLKNHCIRMAEENGAKLSRLFIACASGHEAH